MFFLYDHKKCKKIKVHHVYHLVLRQTRFAQSHLLGHIHIQIHWMIRQNPHSCKSNCSLIRIR